MVTKKHSIDNHYLQSKGLFELIYVYESILEPDIHKQV